MLRAVFELGPQGGQDINRQETGWEGLCEQSPIAEEKRQFVWNTGYTEYSNNRGKNNGLGNMDKMITF